MILPLGGAEEAVRVLVEDIPRPGQTIRLGGPGSHDAEVVATALEGEVTQLDGTLTIKRQGANLEVAVKAHAAVNRPCDRCGAAVPLVFDVEEELAYQPSDDSQAHKEIELKADELDIGFLRDGGIDTDDVVSEAFALASPRRVTCVGDACVEILAKGEERGADDVVGHPAFQALKKLL